MNELQERTVQCPYCGEDIEVLLDGSESRQDYIEDCQVCCRPINFALTIELDGTLSLAVSSDTE